MVLPTEEQRNPMAKEAAELLRAYRQARREYVTLHRQIVRIKAEAEAEPPRCPLALLEAQAAALGKYLQIMEIRFERLGMDSSDLA